MLLRDFDVGMPEELREPLDRLPGLEKLDRKRVAKTVRVPALNARGFEQLRERFRPVLARRLEARRAGPEPVLGTLFRHALELRDHERRKRHLDVLAGFGGVEKQVANGLNTIVTRIGDHLRWPVVGNPSFTGIMEGLLVNRPEQRLNTGRRE